MQSAKSYTNNSRSFSYSNPIGSDKADALFDRWAGEEVQLIAPAFCEVDTRHSAEQRERAWEIASEFQFPTVYDATYLALAELSQCEFWTADEKLFMQVRNKLTYVQWLGNYSPVS